MTTAPARLFDPTRTPDDLSVRIEPLALDALQDLGGHVLLRDNDVNFYFWGKDPQGGGAIVIVSRATITFNGLTQLGLVFHPTADLHIPVNLEMNCFCKSEAVLAVGRIMVKTGAYEEFGQSRIKGTGTARIRKDIVIKKGESFFILPWQTEVGDAITVLDYFKDGPAKWKNVITFG